MGKNQSSPPARLRATAARKPTHALSPKEDVQKLLHELEVHQIELEMQNAELLLAQEEAEEARAKYTELYDFAPVGFLTLDQSSEIKMANLTAADLAGVDRSRLVGKRFTLRLPLPSRAPFHEFLDSVFKTSDKQSIDSELLVKGRASRPVFIVAQIAPNGYECRLTLSDATKRKGTEEALRRNFTLFSNLFEQTPISVFVIGAAFQILQVNEAAKPNFGKIAPLLGLDLREILAKLWPKRAADRIAARFRKTLETGESYVSPGFRERRKDTKALELYEWQIQRLALPDGEFGVVAFFNNITERQKPLVAQRRLDMLTASNLKLKQEVIKRQAIAKSLRQAKREQASLLKKSDRQGMHLRDLSHRILKTQEDERKRISRELHDVVVQSLVGINFQLAAMGNAPATSPQQFRQKIEHVQNLVQNSMDLVHSFARELRPSMLDDLGLVPALQTLMKHYFEETGIRVSLKVFEGVERIEAIERVTLYRVAQEALANVARHARASLAKVSILNTDGTICMTITDNGQGFATDVETLARKKGRLGMLGMKERVEMVGGTFSVRSSLGESTTVQVDFPFRDDDSKTSSSAS